MRLENRILESDVNVKTYKPEDIVMVVDTSLLKALSNRHVWAYQRILELESIAHSRRTKWEWRAPQRVIDQYNHFLRDKTLEKDADGNNTNNLLALHSLEELLDIPGNMNMLFASYTPKLAKKVWEDSPEGRKQARSRDPRKAGKADLNVIEFALGIAQSGADVYVASSDTKDVIRPLREHANFFAEQRWRITPMGPSPIDSQYWNVRGQKLLIKATITGEAISALQGIKDSSSSYYVVVFEKNVQSGNATFDAGVGIAEKEYFKPFNLPQKYSSISENYHLVPVVKVKSLQDEGGRKKAAQASKSFNESQLVVIEESQPHFPTLVTVGDKYIKGSILPIYRMDLEFLYWQANSAFAKATYKPVFMRK